MTPGRHRSGNRFSVIEKPREGSSGSRPSVSNKPLAHTCFPRSADIQGTLHARTTTGKSSPCLRLDRMRLPAHENAHLNPNRGLKTRQLPGEFRASLCRRSEVHELLAEEVIQCARDAKMPLDSPRCPALLYPDLVKPHAHHYTRSLPWTPNTSRQGCNEFVDSTEHSLHGPPLTLALILLPRSPLANADRCLRITPATSSAPDSRQRPHIPQSCWRGDDRGREISEVIHLAANAHSGN